MRGQHSNEANSPKVFEAGSQRINPWAGGFGTGIFQCTENYLFYWDLDGKFYQAWDKIGDSPQYGRSTQHWDFPLEQAEWVRFHESPTGIFAFFSNNGLLQIVYQAFQSEEAIWISEGAFSLFPLGNDTISTFIPTDPGNIPWFFDREGDGDVDFINFNTNSQGIDFFENTSSHPEKFEFIRSSACWGQMEEAPDLNRVVLNTDCNGKFSNAKHTGGALNGFIHNDTCYLYISNLLTDNINEVTISLGKSVSEDLGVQQENDFPQLAPISRSFFPGFQPNSSGTQAFLSSYGRYNSTTNAPPYYTGSEQWTLSASPLENTSLDAGADCFPAAVDWNGDGKKDVVLAAYLNDDQGIRPNWQLLSASNEGFNLTYLPIPSALESLSGPFFPDFADLTQDGVPDMVVTTLQGQVFIATGTYISGQLHFSSPDSLPLEGGGTIAATGKSYARFIDFDGDGKLDIALSSTQSISAYLNKGSTFQLEPTISDQLTSASGTLSITQPVGFGVHNNQIWVNGPELKCIYPGTTSEPLVAEPYNLQRYANFIPHGNGFYFGTLSGGVQWRPSPTSSSNQSAFSNLFPNPSKANEQVLVSHPYPYFNYIVHSISGEIIHSGSSKSAIHLKNLVPGIYFVTLSYGTDSTVRKWVVK